MGRVPRPGAPPGLSPTETPRPAGTDCALTSYIVTAGRGDPSPNSPAQRRAGLFGVADLQHRPSGGARVSCP
ncbi:hypothetical protein GCM10010254_06940 [Streptomyces chromofuscus]|nr:hypothetical protein GCM10010254_06940 [Streptomyces chromofuscus]